MRGFKPGRIIGASFRFEPFPAGKPDPHAAHEARLGKKRGKRPVLTARLAHQTQGLPKHPLKNALRQFGIGKTLVAAQKMWRAARNDDADGLLEARIVARKPADIGQMLPVAIDDHGVDIHVRHAGQQPAEPQFINPATERWLKCRRAEIGELDLRQDCLARLHADCLLIAHGSLRLTTYVAVKCASHFFG